MTVGDLQRLFDYGYWANRRLLPTVSELAPEEFTGPVAGSPRSIRDILVHVVSAEWGWVERCGGPKRGPALEPHDHPTAESLAVTWGVVERHVRGLLSGLGDRDLARDVEFTVPPGREEVADPRTAPAARGESRRSSPGAGRVDAHPARAHSGRARHAALRFRAARRDRSVGQAATRRRR
jgi:uncharacterized damage-inducible protein DinB